jgi:DNA-binding transcriptional LysR family regulator
MTDMTVRQLEYFVATVETGTFSEAAHLLGVTQSAISLATAELERALGVQLFLRRKAKGPALTGVGRELLSDARRLVVQARELQSNARSVGNQVAGKLVVGCFPTISPYVMGTVLQGLPRLYPDLEVSLVEDSVEGLQARLRAGTCEVAIMYDIGITPQVHATPIYSLSPHAVLPAAHRLAAQGKVQIADLIEEPMIMIDMAPSSEFFLGLLARAGFTPDVRYRGSSIETVRSLVGRGMGWSLLLHKPVPQCSHDGSPVIARDLADITESVDVLVVRDADLQPTRRVAAFVAFCRASLPQITTTRA